MNSCKVIVLGSTGAGKSALTVRLVTGYFMADLDPAVEDTYRKTIEVDGEDCALEILDTVMREEFSEPDHDFMRTCDVALFVYSITSRPSYEELQNFHDHIHRMKDIDRVPNVLVAAQCDRGEERQVTADEGRAVAARWQVPFFETSAKTGIGVEDVFVALVREARRPARDPSRSRPDAPKGAPLAGRGAIGQVEW